MDEQKLRQQYSGRRIAACRERAGISQRALAQKLEVTQASINSWENGENVPRWPVLRNLAVVLDVPAWWLVEPLISDMGSGFLDQPPQNE
jgi:transcriptional regulator with XRE-family HTH domain